MTEFYQNLWEEFRFFLNHNQLLLIMNRWLHPSVINDGILYLKRKSSVVLQLLSSVDSIFANGMVEMDVEAVFPEQPAFCHLQSMCGEQITKKSCYTTCWKEG